MTLIYITLLTNLAPFLLYQFRRERADDQLRYIFPFISLLAFSSFYESIFSFTLRFDKSVWFWVYTFLEFLCIFYFFVKLFAGQYKALFGAFLIGFVLCFGVFTVKWILEGYERRDSYLAIFETLLTFIASVLWFKNIFDRMALNSLWDSPAFYFLSGFILYFSGTLFLFLMSDFVFTSREIGKFWFINVALSLFLNIILTIGIWKGQQKSIRYSG